MSKKKNTISFSHRKGKGNSVSAEKTEAKPGLSPASQGAVPGFANQSDKSVKPVSPTGGEED